MSTASVRSAKMETDAVLRSIPPVTAVQSALTALAVNSHASLLAAVAQDGAVRLFDLVSFTQTALLFRATLGVCHLAFRPDGRWIAVAAELRPDGDIHIINIADPTRSVVLEGHTNTVKCVAWHPNGQILVSSSSDATVQIWQLSLEDGDVSVNRPATDSADEDSISSNRKDSAKCIRVLRDLIGRCLGDATEKSQIAWHPSGKYFACCGKRQEVVFVENESWNVLYRIANADDNSILAFSPNGMYLLSVGTKQHVRIWRHEHDREVPIASEKHKTCITGACWHPKANDIAFIDNNGKLSYLERAIPSNLPHPVTSLETKKYGSKQSSQVATSRKPSDESTTAAASLKTDRTSVLGKLDQMMAELDADQDTVLHNTKQGILPSSHKKPALAASRKSRSIVDDTAKEGTDDDEGDVDDYDDMADFVVDDDGAGYLQDVARPGEMRRYQERSREQAMRELKKDAARLLPKTRPDSLFQMHSGSDIQEPFQSGATPERNGKRYLAFNLVGAISSISGDVNPTIDVEFHDKSIRPFHFADLYGFTMAALSEYGAVFACEASATTQSTVHFRHLDTWTAKSDWTVQLGAGESIKAIALTKTGIAVATDMQYLRLFSYGGVQTHIRSISGPILTMAGESTRLMVVYHTAGAFHGDQSISFALMDLDQRNTIIKDRLPLSSGATLEWIGFSDTLVPLTYDSRGILRGLFLNYDESWIPLLDAQAARGPKNDHYWAVGVTNQQFMFIVCRGDKFPQLVKPVINEIALRVPFAQLDTPTGDLEEKWFQKKLEYDYEQSRRRRVSNYNKRNGLGHDDTNHNDHDGNDDDGDDEKTRLGRVALDKTALQLIQAACQSERVQRALDLCLMLHNIKSIEGAIKLAVHFHLPALAERMNSIKEQRYLAERQRAASIEQTRLAASRAEYQQRVDRQWSDYDQQESTRSSKAQFGYSDDQSNHLIEQPYALKNDTKSNNASHHRTTVESCDIGSNDSAQTGAVEISSSAPTSAQPRKSKNPFAIAVQNLAKDKAAASTVKPGGFLEPILQKIGQKEQASRILKAGSSTDAPSEQQPAVPKRKQMTLFGTVAKAPIHEPPLQTSRESSSDADDADATEMDTDAALSRKKSKLEDAAKSAHVTRLDKFLTRHVSDDNTSDSHPGKENVDQSANAISSDTPPPKKSIDKGKAPADPSLSLKSFAYQRV
eukprot:jgi/Hompol1/2975/HPOL_003097-RA